MPDRTQPRRPQPLKDGTRLIILLIRYDRSMILLDIPEWMDDNLDGDSHPGLATFEQDGTYIRASSTQSNADEKQQTKSSQSNSNESLSQINTASVPEKSPDSRNHLLENSSKTNDSVKSDKSVSPVAETVAVNMTTLPNLAASEPSYPVQKPTPAWEEEFDHHDVATTVVESTLAEVKEHETC